jgi:hypothetical protein
MEFRTKREAEAVVNDVEATAARWDRHAEWHSLPACAGFVAHGYRDAARRLRAEAARIRALLPTLPD